MEAQLPSVAPTKPSYPLLDPSVEALVHDIIGQVAAKWTMLILETLQARGTMRFTQIGKSVAGISQKMLTQTLREMERDGLLTRTVHPVIPPHVDYALTPLGDSLSAAFCGVWLWVEAHHAEIQNARQTFAARLAIIKPPENAPANTQ